VLVAANQAAEAVRVVHRAFALERAPTAAERGQHGDGHAEDHSSPIDVVRSLQQMEELTIDEIALDESQARVSVSNVPDRPGIAARVFEEVARAGIFVDMIVQSTGRDGRANLSFTVPKASSRQAVETAKRLGAELGCGEVDSAPQVAKLSVTGIGMRSHAGVATRTFEALAAAGINIEMVSTSEVRVNVVVEGNKGPAALRKLQEAFADVLR
jgi:aspartate kinase